MKRSAEDDSFTPSKRPNVDDEQDANDLVRRSDENVMLELQNKIQDEDDVSVNLHRQLRETRQNYYVSYMKKVMEKLPIGKNILSTIQEEEPDKGPSGFFKMFSIAKMVVHSEMQCKKLKAFNAVFDMINGLMGRYVHDRVIVPSLSRYVNETQLSNAFHAYQDSMASEDNSSQLELQCITYLVQSELEKKETLKVPHPMFNRFSHQMKAVSQYVISLLGASSGTMKDGDERYKEIHVLE